MNKTKGGDLLSILKLLPPWRVVRSWSKEGELKQSTVSNYEVRRQIFELKEIK